MEHERKDVEAEDEVPDDAVTLATRDDCGPEADRDPDWNPRSTTSTSRASRSTLVFFTCGYRSTVAVVYAEPMVLDATRSCGSDVRDSVLFLCSSDRTTNAIPWHRAAQGSTRSLLPSMPPARAGEQALARNDKMSQSDGQLITAVRQPTKTRSIARKIDQLRGWSVDPGLAVRRSPAVQVLWR